MFVLKWLNTAHGDFWGSVQCTYSSGMLIYKYFEPTVPTSSGASRFRPDSADSQHMDQG